MRTSTIVRAAGGGALALGLVAAGFAALSGESPREAATVAADSASGGSVAGDPVEAMQRDLGLSETEAQELLDAQAEAGQTHRALSSDLGEDFGGSWFDIETGTLTVAVTDAAAADEVTAAGAEAEVVDNGQDELDAVVADLNAEGAELSEGIAGWYPDIRQDSVVITALEGQEAAAQDFAQAAGVPEGAYTVETTEDEPRLYADVVGGDAYSTGGGRCSIGFATETGFVTAGHCGAAGTRVGSQDGSGTGTVTDAEFPGADMAAVETDDGWTPTPAVNDYAGGTVAVAGSEEAPEGASVCRSGSTTGWHCGTIQAKNQSVSYPQGTVNGLTQTDVCAEPGDSGGSWLSDDQAQGVTSGGSGDCTSGGTTFFQPVNPILEAYGVTLLTG
ncbi:S1 family peptidase [Nocardiopsis chromatogenes]|uniref:S1 family peptidase n=1 Tax=Nocardiopsis chromatogenes TaxID=280239 RepID=UPI0003456024|nr:S1 family peptidase [Nocardiopsis chromatogenes]